jgi:hypothetical protein
MTWSFFITVALAGHAWRASQEGAWWTFGPQGNDLALAAILQDGMAAIPCFWGGFTWLGAPLTADKRGDSGYQLRVKICLWRCGKAFWQQSKRNPEWRLTWPLASDKYPPSHNGGKPMFGFKSVVAAISVATMIGTSAFAADMSLAPGKPAGVDKAQLNIGTGTLIIAGASIGILTAVAIVVSNQNSNNSGAGTFAPASTSATSP